MNASPSLDPTVPTRPAAAVNATRRARLRVRYAETDRMGVVYYANYLVWFEVGRTDWLRQAGWTYAEMEADGVSLPVIEAHCVYRRPARYDEEIDIATTARLLTAVRVRFDYEIVRPGDAQSLGVGHTIHAAVDTRGRPCRLPGRIRGMLAGDPAEAACAAQTSK